MHKSQDKIYAFPAIIAQQYHLKTLHTIQYSLQSIFITITKNEPKNIAYNSNTISMKFYYIMIYFSNLISSPFALAHTQFNHSPKYHS